MSLTILDEQPPVPDAAPEDVVVPRQLTTRRGLSDRVFRDGVRASGIIVLVILLLVLLFSIAMNGILTHWEKMLLARRGIL